MDDTIINSLRIVMLSDFSMQRALGLIFSLALFLMFGHSTLQAQETGSLENPTKLVSGQITAQDGSVVEQGRVLVFEDPYPNVVTSSKINRDEGYRLLLDPSKIYIFRIEAPGFFTEEILISTPAGYDYAEITENFVLQQIANDSVLYEGEPFVAESADFTEAGISSVVSFLKENPTVEVTIEVGLVEDAVDPVSKQRVGAIKHLFVENELSLTRITWSRDLDRPFNNFAIRISGFLAEEDS